MSRVVLVAIGLASSAWAGAAEIHVRADQADAVGLEDNATNTTFDANGHVRVTSRALLLRGPHLTVTRHPRIAIMDGGVVGTEGLLVISADRMEFDFDAHSLGLTNGQLVAKVGVTVADLKRQMETEHPELVRKLGHDALTLRADRVTRGDDSVIQASHVFFTTCAADEGCTPLLSFTASSAKITPGVSAALTSPVFRLFQVPVFWLPWVSIPLSDRKTGLLFPAANFTGPGGFDLAVPVFITLGESADLTVAARYFQGTSYSSHGGDLSDSLGVRGFGDEWELRWRPALEAFGSLQAFHVYDTSEDTNGVSPRGNRGALRLLHQQPILGGRVGVDLDLVSDSDVLIDTALLLPRRNMPYLRSGLEFSRAMGDTSLAFDSHVIQDLRPQCDAGGLNCVFARDAGNRLPATIAPIGRLVLAHEWPIARLLMDGRLTASFENAWPGEHFTSNHAQRFISDANLVQTLPLLGGRFGTVAFSASERGQFISRDDNLAPGWRGGGFADLLARSRIARTYDSGWVHDLVPSFHLRALGVIQAVGHDASVPFSSGLFPQQLDSMAVNAPRLLQSDLDMALPHLGAVQAISRLSTSWSKPGVPLLTLAVEHHLAFAPFDAGQFRGSIDLRLGVNHLVLDSSVDLTMKTWTGANVSFSRPFGLSTLTLGAHYFNGGTDDLIARGLDVLFTPRIEIPLAGTISQQVALGGSSNIVLGAWRIALAANLTKTLGQASVTQDYFVQAFYEAESCGRVSLSLHWIHQPGQPFAAPIPVPNFELGNVRQTAAAAGGAATVQ
jgi:hypothetical protein